MVQNYPIFKVHKASRREIELEKKQQPYLEKLSNAGYGIKVSDDIYMDMPCYVDKKCLPLEVYHFKEQQEPEFIKIFTKWEELEEFASALN